MPIRLVVDNEPSGETLKDEGIKLSLKGIPAPFRVEWEQQVYDLLAGEKMITEMIRLRMEAKGFVARHKNWWGTLTSTSIRRGALVKTNPPEIWNAQDPDGHSRECRVHIRTGQL
jgi:hypothetical protein